MLFIKRASSALSKEDNSSSGFTLIELLVVIAIIAILSVVVILSLNPAELLRQSRDANRVSDMATISDALNVYSADLAGNISFNLGKASDTYPSVYDLSATSTAGDQCQGLSIPSLTTSAGQTWQCSSSSTLRTVNSQGWIPVNFSLISSGSPIGNLPVDPTNQTSSGLFYSYNTSGTQYEVVATLESQKYKTAYGSAPQTSLFPEVISGGNPTVSALYSSAGLLGYWPMDEGLGSTTIDQSGSNNNGTWSGAITNGSYYVGGKVGVYAGNFNSGGTTKVSLTSPALLMGATSKTLSLWFNAATLRTGSEQDIAEFGTDSNGTTFGMGLTSGNIFFGHFGGGSYDFNSTFTPAVGTWYFAALTYNGSQGILYVNGLVVGATTTALLTGNTNFFFGQHLTNAGSYFIGSIDDVRVYSRALSAAEVMALYNAQH